MRPCAPASVLASVLATFVLMLSLTGCGISGESPTAPVQGTAFSGSVHGGQQPVVGARIYLLAPSTAGYGAASTSLLTSGYAGSDAIGNYVLSDSGGNFSVTGDYLCTPGTQAYLYATGGNPGAGTNTAVGLMTMLGNCPTAATYAPSEPVVTINEASTIAAAYAMAGFATDATHVGSSGSPAALTGLKNAFAASSNLVNLRFGYALSATPNGNGTPPQAEINTLANILAACINSTGTQTACATLLSNALSGGATGTKPAETATAAINIAHHPGLNIAALYNLQPGTGAVFLPALTAAPNDFSLGIVWNISSNQIAFDSTGNLWTLSTGVLEYSNSGTLLSPANGYTGGGVVSGSTVGVQDLIIDPGNNVWVTSGALAPTQNYSSNNYLSEFSNSGVALSPAAGFTGGGLNQPYYLASDGLGNIWVGNTVGGTISKFSPAGVPVSGSPYGDGGQVAPNSLAFDNANNLWVSSNASSNNAYALAELSNTGALLRTPSTSSTNEYSNLSVDASNNIWGTIYTQSSNQVFKLTSTGAAATGFPLIGNSAIRQCLATQIDGDGNFWCASDADSIAEISPAGTAISPDAGYVVPNALGPEWIAIDSSGNVWTTGDYNFNNNIFAGLTVELVGAAAPVITPLSLAIQMGKLGARP